MKRVLRFRAWDDEAKEMFNVVDMTNYDGGGLKATQTLGAKPWPVMQFTGLLDKNGKEIYEGDIVVKDGYIWFLEDGKPNYRGTVEWYYSAWNVSVAAVNPDIQGVATGRELNDEGLDEGSKSDWEIIGNIYENPELLTK